MNIYQGWTPNVSPKPANKAQLLALREYLLDLAHYRAVFALDDLIAQLTLLAQAEQDEPQNEGAGEGVHEPILMPIAEPVTTSRG